MAQFVLDVPDMSCQHCVKRISKALEGLGISKFNVDLDNKKVVVEADDIESVISALDEVGYKTTLRH